MSKYSAIAPKTDSGLINHFGSTYKYIPANSRVLDVGCSSGYYGKLLTKNKGCIVDGIEIDPKDREEAEKHLNQVFDINLNSIEWPKYLLANRYDVIFLGDVIEHVINAKTLLRQLGSMLSRGGKIIISTPNIAHLTIRLELLAGNFDYEKTGILDETHLKYFTIGSLTNLVQEAGYSVQEIDYSLNELHPDTIKHHLDQVGLRPTKRFWDVAKKPEAMAYQWKLVISKSKRVNHKKPHPPLKPMQNNYWFVGQTDRLVNENQVLNQDLYSHREELKLLRNELSQVKHSFGYRIECKLRSIIKKFI